MHFIISHTAISWCSTWSTTVVLNACATKVVSLSALLLNSDSFRHRPLSCVRILSPPPALLSDSLHRGLPLHLEILPVLSHSQRSIDFEIDPKHIPICWTYVTAHHSTHAAFYAWFPSAIVSSQPTFSSSTRSATSFVPFSNSVLGLLHPHCTQYLLERYFQLSHTTYAYNTCPQAISLSLVCKMLVLVVLSYSGIHTWDCHLTTYNTTHHITNRSRFPVWLTMLHII